MYIPYIKNILSLWPMAITILDSWLGMDRVDVFGLNRNTSGRSILMRTRTYLCWNIFPMITIYWHIPPAIPWASSHHTENSMSCTHSKPHPLHLRCLIKLDDQPANTFLALCVGYILIIQSNMGYSISEQHYIWIFWYLLQLDFQI